MQLRRSIRFTVPAIVIAGVVGVSALSSLGAAGAQTPSLPPLTAAELLTKVSSAKVPPFSGTVRLTTKLGLPDLGGFGGSIPSSAIGLLTGTHDANIASDGSAKIRVTMSAAAAESSWVINDHDAWSWSSETQTVTHTSIGGSGKNDPAGTGDGNNAGDLADPADDHNTGKTHTDVPIGVPGANPTDAINPPVVANRVLAAIDPSTTVTVRSTAYVAGRAAYELVLTPKSATSTVGEVVLAVDAATGTPLEARIIAKGASSPAIDIGFTSVSFSPPPASAFVFVAPPGATVREVASLTELLPFTGGRHRHEREVAKSGASGTATTDPTADTDANTGANGTTTVGTAWDSVLILTNPGTVSQLGHLLDSAPTITMRNGAIAKLISTALVNILSSSDGRVAIGAVTPAALQAALAQPAPTAAPTAPTPVPAPTATPATSVVAK